MSFRYSFRPLRIDAGGFATMPALNADTGVIVVGGDVEGFFLSSDNGDHWRMVNNGLYEDYWHQCACIAWSISESNTVYACVGNTGSSGGFLVSNDGGQSWAMRSTTVQFSGNHAATPLPDGGEPRSTGNLLVQTEGVMYAATYDQGVYASTNNGSTWNSIGLSGGSYYARGMVLGPSGDTTLYVAMYNENVWMTTDATGTSASWSQLTNAPAIVEEMKVVGTYIYAASGSSGIYRSTDGGTTWDSLNGSFIDTTQSYWVSIDGYVSGSNHIVIVGCYNGLIPEGFTGTRTLVQLTIDSSGDVTYTDLSTNPSNINYQTIPPEGRSWWLAAQDAGYPDWLSGNAFTAGYILIDPTNTDTIYVTGDEGFWRSYDGGTTWQIAINGMPLCEGRAVVVDPTNPLRIFLGTTDFTSFLVTDGIGYDSTTAITQAPGTGTQGYSVAADPVDGSFYLAMGERDINAEGDIYHLEAGSTSWTDDQLNLAGITNAAVATDSFNRTASDGWGTANVGGAWTVYSGVDTAYSVNGTTGNIQLPTHSGGYAIFLDSTSVLNSSGSVNVYWNTVAVGADHFAEFILRSDGTTNNGYLLQVAQSPTGGAVTVVVQAILDDGGAKQIGTAIAVPYTSGDTVTMSYELTGTDPTTINLSAWTGGPSNQPGTWMISVNDTNGDGPQVAGSVGLRADGSTGYTAGALFEFSSFSITTPEDNPDAPNGEVPIGVAVGRDGSNNRFVLAAVWDNGIWRQSGGTWTQVNDVVGTATQSTESIIFALLNGSNYVYVLDRHAGVWRSTDYGVTWTQIFTVNTDTACTGYLALNPTVANELWVSTNGALYKWEGADSGTVGSGITTTTIAAITSPGPIAITPDGVVYCVTNPTEGVPTALMRSVDGGNTWESVGDDSLQGCVTRPNAIAISSNGRIYIGNLSGGVVSVGYNIGQAQNT